MCVEEIVEDLLASGIRPSLAAAGGSFDEAEIAALQRVSAGAQAAAHTLEGTIEGTIQGTIQGTTRPALAFADAGFPDAAAGAGHGIGIDDAEEGGAEGDVDEGESGLGLGATSFVQVDNPAPSALECLK